MKERPLQGGWPDFLRYGLEMAEDKINNLKVDKLFFPRYGENKVLYCQFTSSKDQAKITERAHLLYPNEENPTLTLQILK